MLNQAPHMYIRIYIKLFQPLYKARQTWLTIHYPCPHLFLLKFHNHVCIYLDTNKYFAVQKKSLAADTAPLSFPSYYKFFTIMHPCYHVITHSLI